MVEVRWMMDIVMAIVFGFEEDVLSLVYVCAQQHR